MNKKNNLKQRMNKIFIQSKCMLTDEQLEKFYQFYILFEKYNDEWDLSRIKNFDDIIMKHFVDSIYVAKLYDLPASVVDIGTGAGFPGLPIKIMSPETHIILAEPRHKRVKFMNMVIEELNLEKVEVYPHKVTDESAFNVEGIITRAFESINNTFERCINFLPKGGKILFMKGPGVDEDYQNISDKNKDFFKLNDDISYTLPLTTHKRRLVVYEKITENFTRTFKFIAPEKTTFGKPISSSENKKFKEYKKLTTSQGIKKSGLTIITGKKQIIEICYKFPHLTESLIVADGYIESDLNFNHLIDEFDKKNKLLLLKKSLYNELDQLSTNSPILICKIPEIKTWQMDYLDHCTLLIPFQDPANVGSIIRSALAFGVSNIVVLAEAANPFHIKSIRSSGGTVFNANIFKGPSIKKIAEISEKENLSIISLDKDGQQINTFNFPDKFLLLPGIEGPGLPEALKDNSISIPISENVESLNATVATSIVLFSWKSQIN